MSPLEQKLLQLTREAIEEYRLFNIDEDVYVGLSGGKDSVATCLLLKSLGYNVTPIIVDVYDPGFHAQEIKHHIDEKGFNATIIDVHDPEFLNSLSELQRQDVQKRLEYLSDVPEGLTACTDCYNVKVIAFYHLITQRGGRKVVIGQHRDDMATSMLKCYWTDFYYNQLTKTTGQPYDGKTMKEFIETHEIDLRYLKDLIDNGWAATDDPIREHPIEDFEIVRPLAKVKERDIKSWIEQIGYPITSGDISCRYRRREPRPFRLLVQWDLEKRLENNSELDDALLELVLKGMSEDGTLKFRPRNLREKLYPGFKPFKLKY